MIGERVKHFRIQRGMTQQELADRAGTETSRICRVEKGGHENMQVGNLIRLAEALEVHPGELIAEYEPEPEAKGFFQRVFSLG